MASVTWSIRAASPAVIKPAGGCFRGISQPLFQYTFGEHTLKHLNSGQWPPVATLYNNLTHFTIPTLPTTGILETNLSLMRILRENMGFVKYVGKVGKLLQNPLTMWQLFEYT